MSRSRRRSRSQRSRSKEITQYKKYFVHDVESIFISAFNTRFYKSWVVGLFLRNDDDIFDACFMIYTGRTTCLQGMERSVFVALRLIIQNVWMLLRSFMLWFFYCILQSWLLIFSILRGFGPSCSFLIGSGFGFGPSCPFLTGRGLGFSERIQRAYPYRFFFSTMFRTHYVVHIVCPKGCYGTHLLGVLALVDDKDSGVMVSSSIDWR